MPNPNPKVLEVIAGTTIKLTWVNTGTTVDSLVSRLIDKTSTMVSSAAAVSSGNGAYYAMHSVPNSRAWYVNEWFAYINPNTYVARQLVEAVLLRVNSL